MFPHQRCEPGFAELSLFLFRYLRTKSAFIWFVLITFFNPWGSSVLAADVLTDAIREGQPSECARLSEYQTHCRSVTHNERCSQQFYDLCCRCEGEWEAETQVKYQFCSFTPSLFPTPTPLPTPTPGVQGTATPEPVDPSIVCAIRERELDRRCDGASESNTNPRSGSERFVFDGSASHTTSGTPVTYEWGVQCDPNSADLEPLVAVFNTNPPQTPATTDTAMLLIKEPVMSREVRCSVNLIVRAGGKRNICTTELLINNCDLGCTSSFIQDTLVGMDGGALRMRRLITKMIRELPRRDQKSRTVRKLNQQNQAAYLAAWRATWAIPVLYDTVTLARFAIR